MNTIDITYLKMAIGFTLLMIPIYLMGYYKTNLVRTTLIAIARMTIQLFSVGIYLKFLFALNNAWVNVLWVMIMVVVASSSALSSTKLSWKKLVLPISISFLTSLIFVGGFFLSVVISLPSPFDARYFISICGILLGNLLSTNIVGLNAFFSSLKRERTYYQYLLGNGATHSEAKMPFIRQAMVKAFNPTIANMAVMGLVALPGTMIGQIIGGSAPDVSIKYQIMIMVIIFTSSTMSVAMSINLAYRRMGKEFT